MLFSMLIALVPSPSHGFTFGSPLVKDLSFAHTLSSGTLQPAQHSCGLQWSPALMGHRLLLLHGHCSLYARWPPLSVSALSNQLTFVALTVFVLLVINWYVKVRLIPSCPWEGFLKAFPKQLIPVKYYSISFGHSFWGGFKAWFWCPVIVGSYVKLTSHVHRVFKWLNTTGLCIDTVPAAPWP